MKMRTLLLSLIIVFVSASAIAQEGVQKNENSFTQAPYNFYGQKISPDDAMNPQQFLAAMENKDSLDVKLKAKIITCCKKKGCWMDVDLENGSSMKVRFKDYEFFVPKNADGKVCVIEGRAKMETIDVATLKHYAEDAGKSEKEIAAITEPEKGFSFLANGVIIY